MVGVGWHQSRGLIINLIFIFFIWSRNTFCGTTDYIAPEILAREPQSIKTDVWCLGILLFEMLVGSTPFFSPTIELKMTNIAKMEVI